MDKIIARIMIKVGIVVKTLLFLSPLLALYYAYNYFSVMTFTLLLLSICYDAHLLKEQKKNEMLYHYYHTYKEIKERKGLYKEHYDINVYKSLCDNLFGNEIFDDYKN